MAKTEKPAAEAAELPATASPTATEEIAVQPAGVASELPTQPEPTSEPATTPDATLTEPETTTPEAASVAEAASDPAAKGDDILLAAAQDGEQPAPATTPTIEAAPETPAEEPAEVEPEPAHPLAAFALRQILGYLATTTDGGGISHAGGQFVWGSDGIRMDSIPG
jgi:hypothetical protein